jgi:hypothetical protein
MEARKIAPNKRAAGDIPVATFQCLILASQATVCAPGCRRIGSLELLDRGTDELQLSDAPPAILGVSGEWGPSMATVPALAVPGTALALRRAIV